MVRFLNSKLIPNSCSYGLPVNLEKVCDSMLPALADEARKGNGRAEQKEMGKTSSLF
ncbi:hypothetical protein SAMN05443144_10799 [Fodinibius roseus]|uniref:Uncharacterized protein n=1 Tax=Fodinibius roseus TaxID=1194090 RepID=A0A1M5AKR2_9BACT|nr:hypothetical protein SAMN05443144_10799 [Fodinibius roseus]